MREEIERATETQKGREGGCLGIRYLIDSQIVFSCKVFLPARPPAWSGKLQMLSTSNKSKFFVYFSLSPLAVYSEI